jgi:phenylacetate-coenzyme A ligase PaaK-like adenylate-forming protein
MNYWQKYLFKKLIRITPLYHRYKKRIIQSEKFNLSELQDIIKNIPYYQERGYEQFATGYYPYLNKSEIIGKEEQLVSKKINRFFLTKVATSGTSGKSLNIYKTISDIIKEEAFIQYAFSIIGNKLRIAVLRGNNPSSGIYEYKYGHLLLSSYHITRQNILEYLELIKKYKINCLHVYPSSFYLFCKYLQEAIREHGVELPAIKGVLSSSEILTSEMKDEILKLFPDIVLVDLYGQNEHVAFALSINKGPYHFYDTYSIVEFLDTGLTSGDNKIKEIIGTNIDNKGMPLIRYRTEDFVEVDKENNIVSIVGRTSDFVVNKNKNIVPCNVSTRNSAFENVILSQHYQEQIGELILRVQVNEKFKDKDARNLENDIAGHFQGLMQVKVEIVKNFDKTLNGKHINLVQKLNLKEFGLTQKDERELHVLRSGNAKWADFAIKALAIVFFEQMSHGLDFCNYL